MFQSRAAVTAIAFSGRTFVTFAVVVLIQHGIFVASEKNVAMAAERYVLTGETVPRPEVGAPEFDKESSPRAHLDRGIRALELNLGVNIAYNDKKEMAYHLDRFFRFAEGRIHRAEYDGTVVSRQAMSRVTIRHVETLRSMARVFGEDGFSQHHELKIQLRDVAERLSLDSITSDCALFRMAKRRADQLVVLLALGSAISLTEQQSSHLKEETRRLTEWAKSLNSAYGCDHLLPVK